MPKPPTPKPTPTKPEPKTPIGSHYAIPPISSIPEPPVGYSLTVRNLRGVKPRRSELMARPGPGRAGPRLVPENAKVFGTLAPPHNQVIASLRQGPAVVRDARRSREVGTAAPFRRMSWKDSRTHLKRLRPAFDLATKADRNLATAHVSLAQLLGAMEGDRSQGGLDEAGEHEGGGRRAGAAARQEAQGRAERGGERGLGGAGEGATAGASKKKASR